MKSPVILAVLLFLAACGQSAVVDNAAAAEGEWTVDMTKSRLGFTGEQTGKSFTGEFTAFEATIILDPDDLESASIDVSIDMSSAKTGDRQRDSALPGPDWFAAKKFPEARFVSNEIMRKGEGAYEARGRLTIRDIAHDLVLPFTLMIEGDAAVAKGSATLIRTEYDVGKGEFSTGEWVGLEVKVEVDITATR